MFKVERKRILKSVNGIYLFFILWLNTFFILYTMVQKERGLVLIFITTRLCRNTYPPARDRFIKFRVKYTRSFHRVTEFHRSNIFQTLRGSSTHKMKIRSTRSPMKNEKWKSFTFFSPPPPTLSHLRPNEATNDKWQEVNHPL